MSIGQLVRENAIKAVVATAVTGVVGISGAWLHGLFERVVMKEDLEHFAAMIGDEVGAQIEPLARQQRLNTQAICTARREALRAALRDLRVELAQMQREQGGPGWDNRDEALLREWTTDLEDATDELSRLDCR